MTHIATNAVITADNLISFSSVPKHQKSDILDILIYADFFAHQAYRPNNRWVAWTTHYRKQLQFAGCQLVNRFDQAPTVINNICELDDLSFRVRGLKGADCLEEMARRSFKAVRLKSLARHFFQHGTGSGFQSNFQVIPCTSVGEDNISIVLCALHVSTEVTPGGLFNLEDDREMEVRLEGGLYSFSTQAYAENRQHIEKRLEQISGSSVQLNI